VAEMIPLGRMGLKWDIAMAAVYFASAAGGWGASRGSYSLVNGLYAYAKLSGQGSQGHQDSVVPPNSIACEVEPATRLPRLPGCSLGGASPPVPVVQGAS
jgi:hypothetical protein